MTPTTPGPTTDELLTASRRPTVLCIDDDPDISRSIELRLRAFHADCLRAYYGTHGIWESMHEKPDVIILDFNMPQGRGDYVLETLKQNQATRGIPVILLTGEREMEQKLRRLGADSFLTKPIHIGKLFAELSRFIELRPVASDV